MVRVIRLFVLVVSLITLSTLLSDKSSNTLAATDKVFIGCRTPYPVCWWIGAYYRDGDRYYQCGTCDEGGGVIPGACQEVGSMVANWRECPGDS